MNNFQKLHLFLYFYFKFPKFRKQKNNRKQIENQKSSVFPDISNKFPKFPKNNYKNNADIKIKYLTFVMNQNR